MKNNFFNRLSLFSLLFAYGFILSAQTNQTQQIHFIEDDYSLAKSSAAESGKFILLAFTAKWCLPCKMMNKYVWTDPNLIEMVQQSCVAMKADFDKFDNFPIRQGFEVETLPTILLLKSNGEIVERLKSCTATELINYLNFHAPNSPSVREIAGETEPAPTSTPPTPAFATSSTNTEVGNPSNPNTEIENNQTPAKVSKEPIPNSDNTSIASTSTENALPVTFTNTTPTPNPIPTASKPNIAPPKAEEQPIPVSYSAKLVPPVQRQGKSQAQLKREESLKKIAEQSQRKDPALLGIGLPMH